MTSSAAATRAAMAQRLQQLPPYLFVEMDRAKRRLEAAGKDVIDLGVGDPDLPPPAHVVEALKAATAEPGSHRYSTTEGLREFRAAIAQWVRRRFDVVLDPDTEILPLLGSKEGIGHLPLALADPGDAVLVPDPCYPPYRSGTLFAGAEVVPMPLTEAEGFFPDLGAVSQKAARRAAVMFLNYPNNPTAATASLEQLSEATAMAREYGFVLAHDAAYAEVTYDGYRAPSVLQVPDAKDVAVEFHSLSKTYHMTGWRVGWVCGNAQVIAALNKLKSNLDSGIYQPIQRAGIAALEGDRQVAQESLAVFQERRDLVVDGLARAGWSVPKPKAAFYVWARLPRGGSSMAFAGEILERAHVVVTPGVGFGPSGEGYVRLSLTVPTERLQDAVTRLAQAL